MKRAITILSFITLGCAVLFVARKVLFPSTASARVALERISGEFDQIAAPSAARRLDRDEFYKSGYASVQATFDTSIDWPGIVSFYDRQLAERGWNAGSSKNLKEWARRDAGKLRAYCKGDMLAELQYDRTGRPGWRYALSLQWNGGTPCAR